MKTRVALAAGAVLALCALEFSAAQNKAEPESQILALESRWNTAYERGDVAAMDSLLARRF